MNDYTSERHIKRQLWKFNLYGFFKNLKFFDPYLLFYLISSGLSLLEIGILFSIRETMIYLFEIPSGIIADKLGKKTELVLCFLFYIASFVLFFIGGSFVMFVYAIILYGLGEAFRSGTHKAMIMDFMDYHDIKENKSKIYGLTRSYSMIGSALSSVISIVLVLVLPELSLLFLIAIVPYIIDLLLIVSYPKYLNEKTNVTFGVKDFFASIGAIVIYVFKEKKLNVVLFDSASYNAIFKTIKDYIQPMLMMLTVGFVIHESLSVDDTIVVILGVIYTVIFIVSSIVSKHSHKLLNIMERDKILCRIWGVNAIVALLLGIFNQSFFAVVLLFISLYALLNVRKPVMVEKIGDNTDKDKRTTILSIESQMTSLIIIVIAPLFGYLFDTFGVDMIFYLISVISVVFVLIKKPKRT